jgi:hypothetical protein
VKPEAAAVPARAATMNTTSTVNDSVPPSPTLLQEVRCQRLRRVTLITHQSAFARLRPCPIGERSNSATSSSRIFGASLDDQEQNSESLGLVMPERFCAHTIPVRPRAAGKDWGSGARAQELARATQAVPSGLVSSHPLPQVGKKVGTNTGLKNFM